MNRLDCVFTLALKVRRLLQLELRLRLLAHRLLPTEQSEASRPLLLGRWRTEPKLH